MNEFGFSGEMEDEAKKGPGVNGEVAGAAPAAAAIEDKPSPKPSKAKSKKDKKRD